MRILKDSSIYLIGELLNKTLPFLLLPYLTRKLGVEGFGELSYYLTILALLSIFIGLSQDGAVTRYFYFYGSKSLDLIIRAGYLYNIIFSSICLLISWVLRSEIIAYITLIATFNSFLSVQLAIRQVQKQPIPYIVIQFLSSASMVVLTIFMLEFFAGDPVVNRMLALLFSGFFVFIVAYFVINKKFKIKRRFSSSSYKIAFLYVFSFGAPLIFHQLSFFVKGQVDRLFIYQLYSPAELGVYSAGVQMASILTIALIALNKAIVPYYYEGLKNNTLNVHRIKKYTLISFVFVGFPALICLIIPSFVFEWFLGGGFKDVKYFCVIFLFGFGLILPYLLLVNFYFYTSRTGLIAKINIYSALIYLLLVLVLSKISLHLIPLALIFSNLLLVILLYLFMGNDENISVEVK